MIIVQYDYGSTVLKFLRSRNLRKAVRVFNNLKISMVMVQPALQNLAKREPSLFQNSLVLEYSPAQYTVLDWNFSSQRFRNQKAAVQEILQIWAAPCIRIFNIVKLNLVTLFNSKIRDEITVKHECTCSSNLHWFANLYLFLCYFYYYKSLPSNIFQ
jgi:hypothetical protein